MTRVLLCVRGGAHEVSAVVDALRDRGAEPIVLDSSKFPDGALLTLSYDHGEFHGRWCSDDDGNALSRITAVWQCAAVGVTLPAMAPGVRETCIAASELALVGLLDNLDVFQLDPHARQLRAESKPRQLRVAQALGLEIPDTIISNDPAAVRAFARGRRGIVAKMLVQPASTGAEPTGEVSAVFTTAMTADDLVQLDGLDLCPMIFQDQVDNRLDVRVTIIGKRMFAAAIDAAREAATISTGGATAMPTTARRCGPRTSCRAPSRIACARWSIASSCNTAPSI